MEMEAPSDGLLTFINTIRNLFLFTLTSWSLFIDHSPCQSWPTLYARLEPIRVAGIQIGACKHHKIAVITVEPADNFFCLQLHANEAKGSIQWEMTH